VHNMTSKKVELSGTLSKSDRNAVISIAIQILLARDLIVLEKCLNESLNLSRATLCQERVYANLLGAVFFAFSLCWFVKSGTVELGFF